MSATPEPLVTAEDVARLLSMTPAWVLAEARADRLPHYRLGRRVRFRLSEIEEWTAEQRRDLRVLGPKAPRNPAPRAGSRGRVPTVTPPALLHPDERRTA